MQKRYETEATKLCQKNTSFFAVIILRGQLMHRVCYTIVILFRHHNKRQGYVYIQTVYIMFVTSGLLSFISVNFSEVVAGLHVSQFRFAPLAEEACASLR